MSASKAASFNIKDTDTSFPSLAAFFSPVAEATVQLAYANQLVSTYQSAQTDGVVPVRVTVPARFVEESGLLTSSLAVSQFKDALIERIGAPLVAGDILTLQVIILLSFSFFFFFFSLFFV
jgi:hypothetical protein